MDNMQRIISSTNLKQDNVFLKKKSGMTFAKKGYARVLEIRRNVNESTFQRNVGNSQLMYLQNTPHSLPLAT